MAVYFATAQVVGRFIRIPPGVELKLTKEQVRRRRYGLEQVKGSVYTTTRMVEFKKGETFKIAAGSVSKVALRDIDLDTPEEPKKKTVTQKRRAAAKKKTGTAAKKTSADETPDDVGGDMDPTADGSLSE